MNNRDNLYADLHLKFNKLTRGWEQDDPRHAELDGLLWELSEKMDAAGMVSA